MSKISENSPANPTGALKLSAHSFASIARPGDVFSFEGKRYVVESAHLDPLVLRVVLGGNARVILTPRAFDEISWEEVAS